MKNKIVLLIGGSSGLGEAIAYDIVNNYSKKVLIIGRNEQKMKSIVKKNKNLLYYKVDITKNKDIDKLINYLKTNYIVTSVINSATIQNLQLLEKISDAKFNDSMNVNVNGPRKIITKLIKNDILIKNGRVLFISSTSRYNYQSGMGLYSMSKAASFALTNMLKKEYKGKYLFGSLYPGTLYGTKTAQGMADSKIVEIMNLRKRLKEFLHNNKQIRILSTEQVAPFVTWVLFQTSDDAFEDPMKCIINKSNEILSTNEWDIRDCKFYNNCPIECGELLRDLSNFLGD